MIQRQSADPACAISSASGKRQPRTTRIRNCRSTEFALDLNTGSGNLTEVNEIVAVISHCACAPWKNSACSIGSWWHYAAGLEKVNTHLRGTDSDAAHVNTPSAPLSVPLTDSTSCKPALTFVVSTTSAEHILLFILTRHDLSNDRIRKSVRTIAHYSDNNFRFLQRQLRFMIESENLTTRPSVVSIKTRCSPYQYHYHSVSLSPKAILNTNF